MVEEASSQRLDNLKYIWPVGTVTLEVVQRYIETRKGVWMARRAMAFQPYYSKQLGHLHAKIDLAAEIGV